MAYDKLKVVPLDEIQQAYMSVSGLINFTAFVFLVDNLTKKHLSVNQKNVIEELHHIHLTQDITFSGEVINHIVETLNTLLAN